MRKPTIAALAVVLTTAGCAFSQSDAPAADTVVIATHDSWAMSDEVIAAFEEESGLTLEVRPQGDAGELTNKLALTKDSPVADVAFGVDNAFAGRALDEGVFAASDVELPAGADDYALETGADRLVPIDFGDVCFNVDDTWFAERDLTPPSTLEDLTKPAYADLTVVPGATTSSPGLALLLATIADRGEEWPAYWQDLLDNGVKITSGWTDAYTVDFTAGGGDGPRPIVLSYASSPPFTIPEGGDEPTTSALLDTCFRQVEYAGILEGADNPEGARALLDFMLGEEFQSALPEQMYVYPVSDTAELPAEWSRFAQVAPEPFSLPEDEISANRDEWLREWRDLTTR